MAGINGLALGFRADGNVRISKFTALVQSSANPSTQSQQFAAVPAAANAAGVLGVTVEHFVEPNYFVPQSTDPTTVTGTAPLLYNLSNRGLTLQVNGVARCLAAGPINQGQVVNIADHYGRVKAVNESAGTVVYPVGTALHNVTNANDVLQVELNFAQTKV
ncbi:MAG TPA: hypothetical protein VL523_08960 [Terriglobia bacterium]|nr:hypothetical protein [Terriglobia bacterium]